MEFKTKFCILSLLFLLNTAAARPVIQDPELVGGNFEGDILIPEGRSINDFMRSGIIGNNYRWPQNTVVYQLDTNFTTSEKTVINSAINEITSKTCLKFTVRTNQTDYIYVARGASGSGCNSYVGRIRGRQKLNLQASGCISKGIVEHEFIHAIGFYHEHSRTDRDSYITINTQAILPGYVFAFNKYTAGQVSDHGVPYDYQSVMHYSQYAFASNPKVPTITTPAGVTIGQRNGLSAKDVLKIRHMYNC